MANDRKLRKIGLNLALASALLLGGCSGNVADHTAAAKAALAENDLRVAQIELANALKLEPGNAELLLLSGKVSLLAGDAERALVAFRALDKPGPNQAMVSDYVAKALVMQGNGKAALDQLDRRPPSTDIGHAAQVAALLAQGNYEPAFAALDSALKLFPKSVELGLLDGGRAVSLNNFDNAKLVLKRLVALEPNNPDVQVFAGRIAMAVGDLKAADTAFNKVLEVRRDSPLALIALASIAADRGDAASAKAMLERVRKAAPKDPVSASMLAQLALEQGDIATAKDLLQAGGGEASGLPTAALVGGLIAAQQGYHDQAISSLRKFLSDGGQDRRARVALAASLAAVGEPAEAMTVIRPVADAANASAAVLKVAVALASATGDSKAELYRTRLAALAKPDPIAGPMKNADAAIRRRDWAAADAIYSDLLAKGHGTNVILLNNAAAVRVETGDLNAAVALARRAVAIAPQDPVVLDTLGWALYKSGGATPEALGYLRQASALSPDNPEIRQHFVMASSSAR